MKFRVTGCFVLTFLFSIFFSSYIRKVVVCRREMVCNQLFFSWKLFLVQWSRPVRLRVNEHFTLPPTFSLIIYYICLSMCVLIYSDRQRENGNSEKVSEEEKVKKIEDVNNPFKCQDSTNETIKLTERFNYLSISSGSQIIYYSSIDNKHFLMNLFCI